MERIVGLKRKWILPIIADEEGQSKSPKNAQKNLSSKLVTESKEIKWFKPIVEKIEQIKREKCKWLLPKENESEGMHKL